MKNQKEINFEVRNIKDIEEDDFISKPYKYKVDDVNNNNFFFSKLTYSYLLPFNKKHHIIPSYKEKYIVYREGEEDRIDINSLKSNIKVLENLGEKAFTNEKIYDDMENIDINNLNEIFNNKTLLTHIYGIFNIKDSIKTLNNNNIPIETKIRIIECVIEQYYKKNTLLDDIYINIIFDYIDNSFKNKLEESKELLYKEQINIEFFKYINKYNKFNFKEFLYIILEVFENG